MVDGIAMHAEKADEQLKIALKAMENAPRLSQL
jgi:hypothetical protein